MYTWANTPKVLIGGYDGDIYILDSGTSDNGSTIAIEAKGAMLNPYAEKGLKCRLQKIEFYVTKDVSASFLVSVYKDQITTAFKTKTITCTGDGSYAWHVVWCNGEVGEFFRLGLTHTASANAPEIHAIRLWMAPAGPSDKR